jgi:hypothetical protein
MNINTRNIPRLRFINEICYVGSVANSNKGEQRLEMIKAQMNRNGLHVAPVHFRSDFLVTHLRTPQTLDFSLVICTPEAVAITYIVRYVCAYSSHHVQCQSNSIDTHLTFFPSRICADVYMYTITTCNTI